jgi:hypothetical protein
MTNFRQKEKRRGRWYKRKEGYRKRHKEIY